jgi:hypothetical protein
VHEPGDEDKATVRPATLDDIDFTAWQRGDESRGVQIPGTDKGKGKAVLSIGSDDEVSSNNDHPLNRRRRLLHNNGSAISGPH